MNTPNMNTPHSSPETRRRLNTGRVKSNVHSAQLYTQRKPAKHQAEMNMLSAAVHKLPQAEVKTFLDLPCGVGRISVWLGQKGFAITAGDLGEAALELTKKSMAEAGIAADISLQDIFAMTYDARSFDAIICFRLLHHFSEPADQAAIIAELCRCAKKYVLISYLSPYSVTSIRRKARKLITGKPVKQNPTALGQLKNMFSTNGFELFNRVKRSGVLHSLQLSTFVRID